MHTELTRNPHGTPTGQIGVHLTHNQASQPCEYRVAKFPRVPWECPGRVMCARQGLGVDLGMTSVLLPCYYRVSQVGATRKEFPRVYGNFSYTRGTLAVCCRVSQCGQELVRGEIRIFK